MSSIVIFTFDTDQQELVVTIGNDHLIIPGFQIDSTGSKYIRVLNPSGQEMLIKRLVANMTLKD